MLTLTLAAPGGAGSLGASRDIVIDTTAPTVSAVTASPSAGAFAAGGTIDISVTFSEAVVLDAGATLTLTLDTGAIVTLTPDAGDPSVFTGTYTVGAGEDSPDLDSVSLAVTGGALRDAAGNDAGLTLAGGASLASNANVVIDTTDPTGSVDPSAPGGRFSGTADDATGSGVVLVEVSIQDSLTGLFYDRGPAGFTSGVPVYVPASDTSLAGDWATWEVFFPAPVGAYDVLARVTDAAGNQPVVAGPAVVS